MTLAQGEAGRSRDDLIEERRAAIISAAEKLLAVHGFDALRLRDVSKEAGVSIGLIQHYFTTRDELLYETMRVASERRAEQWSRLGSGQESARAKLTALLEGSISDQHRCVIWLETCAASTRHGDLLPDVHRTQEAWHKALRDTIEEGIAKQEFEATIPVEEAVGLLVSLIDGLMVAAAVESADENRQEYRVQLLRDAAKRLLRNYEPSSPQDQ